MSSDAFTPAPTPEPAPAPPAPRFDAEPYRAEGAASLPSTLVLFLGLTAVAVPVGFLASFIGQWFYLVVIFALAIGALLGGAGILLVRWTKVRNPFVAGAAALAGAVAAMGAMHYATYFRDLRALDAQLPPGLRAALEAQGARFDFLHFMDRQARVGVIIGKPGQKNGMNLGYVGSYIYWAVEAVFAAAVAFVMLRASAAAPFCSTCSRWKERRLLARLDTPDREQATDALREGELVRLLQGAWPVAGEGLLLRASTCPNCGSASPVDVALESHAKNAKGQKSVKELAHFTYPGDVLPFLDAPRGRP